MDSEWFWGAWKCCFPELPGAQNHLQTNRNKGFLLETFKIGVFQAVENFLINYEKIY